MDYLRELRQRILRWFLGTRYNPPIWAWRGNAREFGDDEAFIRLYNYISKGGCKDFTELVHYEYDVESMENDIDRAYSYLVFRNTIVWGVSNMIEK